MNYKAKDYNCQKIEYLGSGKYRVIGNSGTDYVVIKHKGGWEVIDVVDMVRTMGCALEWISNTERPLTKVDVKVNNKPIFKLNIDIPKEIEAARNEAALANSELKVLKEGLGNILSTRVLTNSNLLLLVKRVNEICRSNRIEANELKEKCNNLEKHAIGANTEGHNRQEKIRELEEKLSLSKSNQLRIDEEASKLRRQLNDIESKYHAEKIKWSETALDDMCTAKEQEGTIDELRKALREAKKNSLTAVAEALFIHPDSTTPAIINSINSLIKNQRDEEHKSYEKDITIKSLKNQLKLAGEEEDRLKMIVDTQNLAVASLEGECEGLIKALAVVTDK